MPTASASPTGLTSPSPTPRELDVTQLDAACRTLQPFYAASSHATAANPWTAPAGDPSSAAVIAFAAPTAGGTTPYTRTLATVGQVGAVYGLAYDYAGHHVYAAAYLKRMAYYGPGGPGQIYRIDLATEDAELWVQLPAGSDEHSSERDFDADAARRLGKSSFGDIELDETGSTLFVSNLHDAHIWRVSVPDGKVLGSFPFGAMSESWAVKARPFGLGFHDGWLYHALVDPSGTSLGVAGPVGHVYRSRPDGSEMRAVAQFELEPDNR